MEFLWLHDSQFSGAIAQLQASDEDLKQVVSRVS